MIEVIPGLYTRGKLSNSTTPKDLYNLGIRHVVSLTSQGEPALRHWSGYVHLQLSDGKKIETEKLDIVDQIVNWVQSREPTLVMCHAGRNRTGLIVCLVLQKLLKISGKESLILFRERRPRGVANTTFEKYLMSLEKP